MAVGRALITRVLSAMAALILWSHVVQADNPNSRGWGLLSPVIRTTVLPLSCYSVIWLATKIFEVVCLLDSRILVEIGKVVGGKTVATSGAQSILSLTTALVQPNHIREAAVRIWPMSQIDKRRLLSGNCPKVKKSNLSSNWLILTLATLAPSIGPLYNSLILSLVHDTNDQV